MATRQLISAIARQRVVAQHVLKPCQKALFTTSCVRLQTEKKNLADSLSNKFVGQVRRQGKNAKAPEPTRFVQIDALPNTATTEDIRKLAREAFAQGDKSIVDSKAKKKKKNYARFHKCILIDDDYFSCLLS